MIDFFKDELGFKVLGLDAVAAAAGFGDSEGSVASYRAEHGRGALANVISNILMQDWTSHYVGRFFDTVICSLNTNFCLDNCHPNLFCRRSTHSQVELSSLLRAQMIPFTESDHCFICWGSMHHFSLGLLTGSIKWIEILPPPLWRHLHSWMQTIITLFARCIHNLFGENPF